MRCRQNEFFNGGYYHFYNRSIDGMKLFKDDSDFLYYLGKLKNKLSTYQLSILAYCLMPNHFHFFMKQEGNRKLFHLFESVNISYSLHYNHQYKRRGAVLGGPLQHILANDHKYLFYVCQYIHLNPINAGLVNNIIDWPYSNFPEWAGIRNGSLFNRELAESLFGDLIEYSSFVLENQNFLKDEKLRSYLLD